MLNCKLLAGTGLVLVFTCAGAAAQDNQPQAPAPPHPLRLRVGPQGGGMVLGGPRVREPGPRLGVGVESTPDGLKITSIDDGSLAASAGLKADDVLLRIGDHRIHEVDDVALALHGTAPGAEVEVTVVRPGQGLVTLKGTLPEPKPADKPKLPMQGADGVKGGFLGVQMKTDSADGGVAVAGVVPDSAAWFAGLEEGDVLLSIDDKALASPEDLAGAVAGKDPGSFVELKYRRGSDEQTAKVRLGRRSPVAFFGGLGAPGAADGNHPLRLRLGPGGQDAQFDQGDDDFEMPDMDMPDFQQFFGGNFPGMNDLGGAMHELHDALHDGGSHSVAVEIDNDHMTITKDGVAQEYTRDANGQWTRQEDKTPTDATPHGA